MLHNTRAIVLRTVPFGDTSLVVTTITRVYGLQSFLVKGARGTSKKGQSLRPYLQPAALLDLVAYHHPTEHLQYLREVSWARVYNRVLTSIVHHAVAGFMLELLLKCLRHSESNPEFYDALESYFVLLDEADAAVVANLPLHFALFLAAELGFKPENNYTSNESVFHVSEGKFVEEASFPNQSLNQELSFYLHQLLQIQHPVTLYRIKLQRSQRRQLLMALETYFSIHLEGFGHLRSLEVLGVIFDV